MRMDGGPIGAIEVGIAPRPLLGGKRPFRLGVYGTLFLLDCLAIVAALCGTGMMGRRGWPAIDTLVLLPVYLCIAADRRLYSSRFFQDWKRTAYDAVRSLLAALVAVVLVGVCLHGRPAALFLALAAVPAGVLLVALRGGVHARAMAISRGEPITTLVIADGVDVAPGNAAVVIGSDVFEQAPGIDDPFALDRFGTLAKQAERVIVACPPARRELWAAMLKGANVQGEIVMPELAALGTMRAASFGDQPTLVVSLGPLDTRNRVLKRGFDLALSLTLLVLIWPLLVVTAIAIKLDSEGPVLFKQQRMGRGNRLFPVYKFRSMRTDLCDATGNRSTQRGDPRVTRVGRFIRASSIDELPQILNVICGDMSVVGPRPHALGSLAGDKLFWHVDRRYWDRHAMKPGITGLAQVHGHRGATALATDLEKRLASDLDYMRGWTIWRDVRILLATAFVVFHRNAF